MDIVCGPGGTPAWADPAPIPGWSGLGGHVGWCNDCHGAGRALPDSVEACAMCLGTGRYRFPPVNVAMDGLRAEFGHLFNGRDRADLARGDQP